MEQNSRCNICGYYGEFGDYLGNKELCPKCNSVQRHRNYLNVLMEEVGDGGVCLGITTWRYREILEVFGYETVIIDLIKKPKGIIMDATAMEFGDNTFNLVLAEAVLEHIIDDKKAMREIYRVMKPQSKCIIYVPFLFMKETDETPYEYTIEWKGKKITDIHQRNYGYSMIKELRDIGFRVRINKRHIICIK